MQLGLRRRVAGVGGGRGGGAVGGRAQPQRRRLDGAVGHARRAVAVAELLQHPHALGAHHRLVGPRRVLRALLLGAGVPPPPILLALAVLVDRLAVKQLAADVLEERLHRDLGKDLQRGEWNSASSAPSAVSTRTQVARSASLTVASEVGVASSAAEASASSSGSAKSIVAQPVEEATTTPSW